MRPVAAMISLVIVGLGSIACSSRASADPVFTPLYWFKYDQTAQGYINGAPAVGPDNTLFIASVTAYGTVYHLTPPASGKGLWALQVLYNFGSDDSGPYGRLLLTPSGDLFGTTANVYELTPPKTGKNWIYSRIYTLDFTSGIHSGGAFGGVIMDKQKRLFGSSPLAGPSGYGQIFMLTPPATVGGPWVKTVLHTFDIKDGMNPQAELVQDTDGTLYGVTTRGGAHYYGTIFKLSPPATAGGKWTFQKLYDFTGGTDNGFPTTALVFSPKHDALYGVAQPAITGETGIVFSLAKPAVDKKTWQFSIIHAFKNDGTDGYGATGGILVDASLTAPVIDKAGNLYGATPQGGASTVGVIYKLSPPASGGTWTETILHTFQGKDGINPSAISLAADGTLYGATSGSGPSGGETGAGGIFSLKP